MKKAKILIAASVVAGLSMIPVAASYADVQDSANATVTAKVGSTITITASGGTIKGPSDAEFIIPGQAGSGNVTLRVKTNTTKGFAVTVTGGSLTASGGNSISANTSAAAGTEGWYIKDALNAAIAPSATAASFWTYTAQSGSTSAIDEQRAFQAIVGTSESTTDGTYSGTLNFTATATVE